MNQVEFGKKCRPLNRKYFEIFGEVPSPSDYNRPYGIYLEALERAVREKVKLERILEAYPCSQGMKS